MIYSLLRIILLLSLVITKNAFSFSSFLFDLFVVKPIEHTVSNTISDGIKLLDDTSLSEKEKKNEVIKLSEYPLISVDVLKESSFLDQEKKADIQRNFFEKSLIKLNLKDEDSIITYAYPELVGKKFEAKTNKSTIHTYEIISYELKFRYQENSKTIDDIRKKYGHKPLKTLSTFLKSDHLTVDLENSSHKSLILTNLKNKDEYRQGYWIVLKDLGKSEKTVVLKPEENPLTWLQNSVLGLFN